MTDAALAANRSNAQKSTGPTSAEGRAKSAANSVSHGLTATSPRFLSPEAQADFADFEAKLRKQCLPDSEPELLAFERYAFSSYQVLRAQRIEVETQDAYLNNPGDEKLFLLMERTIKMTAMLERRADKAFNELRKLQRDRVSALDIHNELYLMEKKLDIPAALPVADMRKSDQSKTTPFMLAMMLLNTTAEVKEIIEKQTKPKQDPQLDQMVADFVRKTVRNK
jgi:hypothetical protein